MVNRFLSPDRAGAGASAVGAILGAMRRPLRPLLVLALAIAAIGVGAAGLAWLLDTPGPRPGAPRAERVFLALCAECHGADGRGSWRAALFLIRPGNLADGARAGAQPDQYYVDIIKHGGAPIGRPGMPAFGAALTDDEIRELVAYLRSLARAR
jgi:mono/diheme cytochrome c family protein